MMESGTSCYPCLGVWVGSQGSSDGIPLVLITLGNLFSETEHRPYIVVGNSTSLQTDMVANRINGKSSNFR